MGRETVQAIEKEKRSLQNLSAISILSILSAPIAFADIVHNINESQSKVLSKGKYLQFLLGINPKLFVSYYINLSFSEISHAICFILRLIMNLVASFLC